MNGLKEKYKQTVVPSMIAKFGYSGKMAVPKLIKVVVNIGFGRQTVGKSNDDQKKFLLAIAEEMALITGQKPKITKAKKSIASFKLREGTPIGAAATLRGRRMEDFLERLIYVVLPRLRDFRGLNQKSFDKNGNLSIGIKEQIVFPEISSEKIKDIFGLEITVVTSAKTREEGIELLRLLGFPLKKEN